MAGRYDLSRVVLLRFLGVTLLAAFLTAAFQNRALLGADGLTPSRPGARPTPFFAALAAWPLRWEFGDRAIEACAWLGVFLSGVLVAWPVGFGFALPLALWALYLSIVNLGQHFVMGYGPS